MVAMANTVMRGGVNTVTSTASRTSVISSTVTVYSAGPSFRAFEKSDRRVVEQGVPERASKGGLALRGKLRRMPANLPEPRRPERLLVRRHLEMVVLDGEGPVLEIEGPRDRRALAPLARRGRLEAVRAKRRRRAKIQGRILVDGDEA